MDFGNKMKILVTFANTYDMPAETGRDAMKGCTVHYFFLGENGEAFNPYNEWEVSRPVGYQRAKVSMDYSIRSKITIAPAVYEGIFAMTTGGDGKPVLKLVDLEYVGPFHFSINESATPSKASVPPTKESSK